eukprot:scaffold219717_cov31-Tisochrysis_lutea.AAC.1
MPRSWANTWWLPPSRCPPVLSSEPLVPQAVRIVYEHLPVELLLLLLRPPPPRRARLQRLGRQRPPRNATRGRSNRLPRPPRCGRLCARSREGPR